MDTDRHIRDTKTDRFAVNTDGIGYRQRVHRELAIRKLIKAAIILLIIVFIVFKGISAAKKYLNFDDISKTPIDNDSTTSIHIEDGTPDNLKTIIESLANENEWDIVDNNSDITIKVGSDDNTTSSIYQFLAFTKPWNQMAQEDEETFSNFSDSIEKSTFELIDQDYFLYDENSETDYLLQPISELDGTRIPVSLEGESMFADHWWDDKNYPLTLEIAVTGNERVEEFVDTLEKSEEFKIQGFSTSYPKSTDFIEIVKTGTTVAGGPGWDLCERTKGSQSYPIDNVKDVLTDADISMISNESSFVDGCTQGAGTTAFCGKPKYIQNLLDMGIDAVSLTGNHMNDYGRDYFTSTLELYTENNIKYYASGKNSDEAWEPLIMETSAGSIAFIGINKMGPDYVLATDDLTGAAYYDQTIFQEKLDEVADDVNIIWLDTHLWPEYGTTPTQEQITVTQFAIDNGVDIVTGVSSHEPLGITFYKNKPIFYGLGNFLFDQMWSDETRLGMVLRTYMFDGKIISIEVIPTRLYDYCQPRFLEGSDKTSILQYLVDISEF